MQACTLLVHDHGCDVTCTIESDATLANGGVAVPV